MGKVEVGYTSISGKSGRLVTKPPGLVTTVVSRASRFHDLFGCGIAWKSSVLFLWHHNYNPHMDEPARVAGVLTRVPIE